MEEVSRLMKLLKPLEFYMTSRKMSRPNLQYACTRDLCIVVGMGQVDDLNRSGMSVQPEGDTLEPPQ